MAEHIQTPDSLDIDPQETRSWLLRGLCATPAPKARDGKKRPFVDTW